MVSPELPPPSPRGGPGRPAARRCPACDSDKLVHPARYVRGLLLGQGLAWLVLAAAGLTAWIVALPTGLNLIADGGRVLWDGLELLGVVIGACLGSAQVVMACRLAGGRPRLLLGAAIGLQGLMFASCLILAAALLTIGGSLLELSALSGLGIG